MKSNLCVLATFALGALPIFAAPEQKQQPAAPAPAPAALEVNGIAAKVNGKVITKNEVTFVLAPIYGQLAAQFPRRGPEFERQFKEAREKTIQDLIDREIVLAEFKDLGGSLKPQVIDDEINRQIRDNYNGDKGRLLEELRKARLTMDGYREMTREKLVVHAMRARQFAQSAPPLPSEISKEYDEVKLKVRDITGDKAEFDKIFVPKFDPKNPPTDQASARAAAESQLALAEDITRKLKEGGDFAALAKAHSADSKASEGGKWPETPRTDLSAEFAAILFNADVNTIVGPLEDPNGFTIFRVTKKIYGPVPPLEKVREQIEQRVETRKNAERYERWIERMRKRAMIDMKM